MALRKVQTTIGLFDITDVFIPCEDGKELQLTLTSEYGFGPVDARLRALAKGHKTEEVKLDTATLRDLQTALGEILAATE